LARSLGDVPWLTEELEVTISRQKGVDYRGVGGSGSTERTLPVVWGASEARTHLKALLVSWALFCASEGVRSSDPRPEMPADNLPALSRWLMWRVDGLMLNDIAPEAIDEITGAVAHCHRLIDRPADRQYLGDCTGCGVGKLYARAGSEWARCDECGEGVQAQTLRDDLLAKLDDRLCTAAEIARLSTYLGLRADRDQVRKRINQWHLRGRLDVHPGVTDEVTFRFGEVYAMLATAEYGQKAG
jgi:hypothetical protein